MIRFGSRGSELARTQTTLVGEELKHRTGESYVVEVIETRGDRILDRPLPEVGGKGLFTAELEDALRSGRIDAAVHSLKDLPVEDSEGLVIGAIAKRAPAHDVLVYRPDREDAEGGTLPISDGTVVGTSSPRRRAAVLACRPHLRVRDIRGNVPTRIAKVRSGEYGGTLLAGAGLQRLEASTDGLSALALPTSIFTPAPGQGALAIQCRRDDQAVRQLLAQLHDEATAANAGAERRILESLGGGCSMPLGALAETRGDCCRLQVSLYSTGEPAHRFPLEFTGPDPAELAERAARELQPLLGEPLAGLHICLVRPGGAGGRLEAGLAVAGARTQTVAFTETVPLGIDPAGVEQIHNARIVAFTSSRAVDRYFELSAAQRVEPADRRFYAGGPATAAAVRARGLDCRAPAEAGGAALARFILESEPDSKQTILFPCAAGRRPDMEEILSERGRRIVPLPVYDTRAIDGVLLPDGPWQYTVFASPSAVHAFSDAGHRIDSRGVAIGPTTAAAMKDRAMDPTGIATEPTPQELVRKIAELEHAHSS